MQWSSSLFPFISMYKLLWKQIVLFHFYFFLKYLQFTCIQKLNSTTCICFATIYRYYIFLSTLKKYLVLTWLFLYHNTLCKVIDVLHPFDDANEIIKQTFICHFLENEIFFIFLIFESQSWRLYFGQFNINIVLLGNNFNLRVTLSP